MNIKPDNQQALDEAYKNWKATPRTQAKASGTGENPPKPKKTYKKKGVDWKAWGHTLINQRGF